MPITQITYKRIKNIGNYQSEQVEATAIINNPAELETEARKLKEFVYNCLYPPQIQEDTDPDETLY